jgi:hypothetical protein
MWDWKTGIATIMKQPVMLDFVVISSDVALASIMTDIEQI